MPTGLRERKKQRTKAAIADAAIELFLGQGFEETTVVEIADAAEVSPRTFFTYFPTKEAVLFGDLDVDLEGLRQRLADRRAGESAVDGLRAWIVETMSSDDYNDADQVCQRQLIRDTPALAAYELTHVDTLFREALEQAVASDLGLSTTDLAPKMVAAAASAALRAMADYYAESDAAHDPEQLLDQAARFLDAGLASLSES